MAPSDLKSVASRRFWESYEALPAEVQALARRTYSLWRENPRHPSLSFRLLSGTKNRYSIRVGIHYRAIGRMDSNGITWVWIGTHAEYDRLIGAL